MCLLIRRCEGIRDHSLQALKPHSNALREQSNRPHEGSAFCLIQLWKQKPRMKLNPGVPHDIKPASYRQMCEEGQFNSHRGYGAGEQIWIKEHLLGSKVLFCFHFPNLTKGFLCSAYTHELVLLQVGGGATAAHKAHSPACYEKHHICLQDATKLAFLIYFKCQQLKLLKQSALVIFLL